MQMGSRGMPRLADFTKRITGFDSATFLDPVGNAGQMRITGYVAAGMFQLDHESVSAASTGKFHRTGSDRHHSRSVRRLKIDRLMRPEHTRGRIGTR